MNNCLILCQAFVNANDNDANDSFSTEAVVCITNVDAVRFVNQNKF
jgi:hypothetical protein